jgi:SAM-dependent methyltransferase
MQVLFGPHMQIELVLYRIASLVSPTHAPPVCMPGASLTGAVDLACGLGFYSALLAKLGAASVVGYDISSTMVEAARTAHPGLHFEVADCSAPENLPPAEQPFDVVFAGWFLNYAGTERELTSMFRVIARNLATGGKFVGVTTNVTDPLVKEDKKGFYGVDVEVLEREYVAPDTGREVGIKARVTVLSEPPFSFDVFQFRSEVYERCAEEAGLEVRWREHVLPNDERRETGYWDEWLRRPTSSIIEAVHRGSSARTEV